MLGSEDYVIFPDEKSELQALSRCRPPPAASRVEFECERHGALAYFGTYDAHAASGEGGI